MWPPLFHVSLHLFLSHTQIQQLFKYQSQLTAAFLISTAIPKSSQVTMSSPKLILILISTLFVLLIVFQYFSPNVNAQVDHSSLQHMSESIGWPMNGSTLLYEESDVEDNLEDDEEDSGSEDIDHGRSLYYYYRSRRRRYYISYGALSANRIPCPARSGRSYYTHNCFKTSRPVNPYSRGCSAITRCRR